MAGRIIDELGIDPTVMIAYDALPQAEPYTLPPAPTAGDEVRWIYYTSGTTSAPKGVRHTDQTLMAGGLGLADALYLTVEDVGSIAFPYAHIAGPDYLMMLLYRGCGAVLIESFVLDVAVELFSRHDGWRRSGVLPDVSCKATYATDREDHPVVATPLGRRCTEAARDVRRGNGRDGHSDLSRLWHDGMSDDCSERTERHRSAADVHRWKTGNRLRGSHCHP